MCANLRWYIVLSNDSIKLAWIGLGKLELMSESELTSVLLLLRSEVNGLTNSTIHIHSHVKPANMCILYMLYIVCPVYFCLLNLSCTNVYIAHAMCIILYECI